MLSLATYAMLASSAVAAAATSWEYPASFLERRQAVPAPDTPAYRCHENCGTLITLARDFPADYCGLDEYNTRFQACMECALTENVWRYYVGGVTGPAQACGLVIATSPSGWVAPVTSTTPPAQPSTTEPPVQPSTTEPPVVVSSEPAPVSSEEPVVGSSAEPVEPSAEPSAAPSAEPSAEPSAVPSAEPSAESSAAPSAEPSVEPSSAPSSGAEEPSASASASGSAPYPVPSGSHAVTSTPATSSEDCETTVTVTSTDCESTTAIYLPVGNHTTLGTQVYPVPSKSGSVHVPSSPAGQTTHSGAQPTESFVASGAAQVVGSFCAVGVAIAAMVAAF